jgi:hypothetical protein
MRNVRIGLALNAALRDYEKKAIERAAGQFSRFGLKTETLDPEKRVFGPAHNSEKLKTLAFEAKDGFAAGAESPYVPFPPVPEDGIFVAGATPFRLSKMGADRRIIETPGVHIYSFGAVISVRDLRPAHVPAYRGTGMQYEDCILAIELRMLREAGLGLLKKAGHIKASGSCPDDGCVMRKADDFIAMVREIGSSTMDFCEKCSEMIKGMVGELRYYGCA